MNLKSFLVKSPTGIHTITNIEVEKKCIFSTDAWSEDNRKGVLSMKGYLNNPNYEIDDEFRKVFAYALVSRVGTTTKQIMSVNNMEHGLTLLDKIWSTLENTRSKKRMVDLTN